jgi:hypothetical protein
LQYGRWLPMFWRNILPLSSGKKWVTLWAVLEVQLLVIGIAGVYTYRVWKIYANQAARQTSWLDTYKGLWQQCVIKLTHMLDTFHCALLTKNPLMENVQHMCQFKYFSCHKTADQYFLSPCCDSVTEQLARCFAELRPWRWRRYVPPKCRVPLNALHSVISQKKILFKTTAVKTSNPTCTSYFTFGCLQYLNHVTNKMLELTGTCILRLFLKMSDGLAKSIHGIHRRAMTTSSIWNSCWKRELQRSVSWSEL